MAHEVRQYRLEFDCERVRISQTRCGKRCYAVSMCQPTLSEIPVTLRLSKAAETTLAERAAATGTPLSAYVSTLVESFVKGPLTLEEISGPSYQQFRDSGLSDEELSEELEKAKHEVRTERRARHAS